jgi:hypothetical protein
MSFFVSNPFKNRAFPKKKEECVGAGANVFEFHRFGNVGGNFVCPAL